MDQYPLATDCTGCAAGYPPVTGKLETPPVFEDFSDKDYLARFGIRSMIRRPCVELIESNQGNLFWNFLYTFKTQASQTINRILPEPHPSYLNGILLGTDTGIPRVLYDQFSSTGTSHIIVISGSNIAGTLCPLNRSMATNLFKGAFLFGGKARIAEIAEK